MSKVFALLVLGCIIISCSRKVDFSNPKSVVEKYYSLRVQEKPELEYNLMADTCKEYATLQDYIEYKTSMDSLLDGVELKIKQINQLAINPSFSKYRRFEIQFVKIDKTKNDTIIDYSYCTVFNEKGKWKVVWTANIHKAASNLMDTQKFSEGMQAYAQVLKYDPLNGSAYNNIGWCQLRQNDNSNALISVTKALELSPKDESNFNLLAGIYLSQNSTELAIENYKKALSMCNSNDTKKYLLSNLSICYGSIEKYDKAKELATQVILIDSNYTHAWFCAGNIYLGVNNLDSAIICFRKAALLTPMDDYLQRRLYFDLANSEYSKVILQTLNIDEKNDLLTNAKDHILKALDLQHNNVEYMQLLYKINNLK